MGESLRKAPIHRRQKRTSFAATYTFLAVIGVQLRAGAGETYAFISGLCEAGTFRFDNPEPWRRNVKTIPV
ncbi:MAG: hypothetical protein OXB98_12200 [Bryobacterales bacterium]|nr:hypothetical protein [Bryobacterales bacterium]